MKKNSQTQSLERGPSDGPDSFEDNSASEYYYDDATGYEVYREEEEEDEDAESQDSRQ